MKCIEFNELPTNSEFAELSLEEIESFNLKPTKRNALYGAIETGYIAKLLLPFSGYSPVEI